MLSGDYTIPLGAGLPVFWTRRSGISSSLRFGRRYYPLRRRLWRVCRRVVVVCCSSISLVCIGAIFLRCSHYHALIRDVVGEGFWEYTPDQSSSGNKSHGGSSSTKGTSGRGGSEKGARGGEQNARTGRRKKNKNAQERGGGRASASEYKDNGTATRLDSADEAADIAALLSEATPVDASPAGEETAAGSGAKETPQAEGGAAVEEQEVGGQVESIEVAEEGPGGDVGAEQSSERTPVTETGTKRKLTPQEVSWSMQPAGFAFSSLRCSLDDMPRRLMRVDAHDDLSLSRISP